MNKKSIFKDGANKNLTHPKKNKGITLIALIITIVVMLILVGIVVSTTINSNLINKVKRAKGEWERAEGEDSNIAGATIDGEYYGSLQDYVGLLGSVSAYGVEGMSDGVLIYKRTSNETVAVSGIVNINTTEVDIPRTINFGGKSYTVTSIMANAFCPGRTTMNTSLLCRNLTTVEIPDTVISIGEGAFCMCKSLTSIIIPDKVTSIGSSAFSGCSGLTSVTIPEGLTSLADSVFNSCSSLTSITIPDNVTSIGSYAFSGCSSLTSVTIPDNVTSIGNFAFYSCSGLTSVTIPDNVTSIGISAFYSCSSLTSVTIPKNITSVEIGVFGDCKGLTSVTIPEGVTCLCQRRFSYLHKLSKCNNSGKCSENRKWSF